MGIFILRLFLFSLSAPLIISIFIILICLYTAFITFSTYSDPWCTIIFLIIFFGGLLVLFIYISSLAHNETLSPSTDRILILFPVTLLTIFSFPTSTPFLNSTPYSSLIFNNINFLLRIGLITYLLLALIVVSHTTNFKFGALRETFVYTS